MKKAFTLAEVLITLAIIGVVASLTIPSVISNYQRHQSEARLKKIYSSLTNSMNILRANGQGIYKKDCLLNKFEDKMAYLDKYIVPYLNVQKKCGKGECFYTIWGLNGKNYDNQTNTGSLLDDNFLKIKLTDGTIIAFYFYINSSFTCMQMYIDTNGEKKPNKVGVDIHRFDFIDEDELKTRKWFQQPIPANYVYKDTPFDKLIKDGCTTKTKGNYCTLYIYRKGFHIPDRKEFLKDCPSCSSSDYPW